MVSGSRYSNVTGGPSLLTGCSEIAYVLYHDQDTIHVEKGWAEMCDFHMAALVFHTGHGIKARIHAHANIAHFPLSCIIRAWEA